MSNSYKKPLKDYSRMDWYSLICKDLLIVAGCILLAFGTAIFSTKLSIVSGGLSGIGIIIQHFIGASTMVIDIFVWIASAVLWVLGFFFVSRRFAQKTLIGTIAYPLFLTLFLRIPVFIDLATKIAGDGTTGNLLLCAIFSGFFMGSGMALTFLGGGSTGGTDVILFILERKLKIKQSISSFVIDGTIILVAMCSMPEIMINSLCGILTAGINALVIHVVYLGRQSCYQADIISDKWEDISRYAQDELLRGATIIPAKGGYKGEERIVLRVVFGRAQYEKLRDYIYKVDPKAFVTFTQTNAVFGEGFESPKKKKK